MVAPTLMYAPGFLIGQLPDLLKGRQVVFEDMTRSETGYSTLRCWRNGGGVTLFAKLRDETLEIGLQPLPRWWFFSNPESEALREDLAGMLAENGASTKAPYHYFDEANLCEAQERFAAAIENYNRAVELQPVFPEAFFNRAGDWELLGEHGKAISDYRTAIEQQPDDSASHECLARVYLETGEFRLACKCAERACELTGFQCFKKLATLARACNAAGRHSDAVTHQSKAIRLARDLLSRQDGDVDRVEQIDAEIMLPDLEDGLHNYRQSSSEGTQRMSD